ncbi:Uma2 family endonuclease [Streptomyces sp. NBC_01340]|uniref:Uma2 family endonuclease n=1 Tax=unclassified Streptomyces TaxID=2593676 RepID=UPI0022537B03|nr:MULTISPECIES: Uma2 family endonuclease [unclassified Streptomyces]MCX4495565.1 Uma2 family endonuclease [Streptomyces sp. NBC_01728]WSI40519.1 Uma2 family endonuclease [Streptomyces sp. NBC_01340]
MASWGARSTATWWHAHYYDNSPVQGQGLSAAGDLAAEAINPAKTQLLERHAPHGCNADVAPFLFSFRRFKRAFGPALHVADESAFEAEGRHADGAALSLVAELTSASTKDADWLDKLDTYGLVVPVYLVLDMQVGEITAFWDPSPKGYRSRTTVTFGTSLHVPPPFGFDLDTSVFAAGADVES